MIKYLELALSQEVYEYLEELDEMNWSARGNVLNQYLRNTSIGTTVNCIIFYTMDNRRQVFFCNHLVQRICLPLPSRSRPIHA